MPLVEVDEAEVSVGRQATQLLTKMFQGATRKNALKIIKQLEPERVIPELEAETAAETAERERQEAFGTFQTEIRDQIGELKTALDADKTERGVASKLEQGRTFLRKQGWSEDEIPKIEARMAELGLTDYKAGSIIYERENAPTPTPVAPSGPSGVGISPLGAATDEDERKLLLDRRFKQFSDKRVADFLAEKRAGQLQF